MSVFPFMEVLLYFLGDTTMISPCNLSIRNELHKVALANNWTSRTTRDKVIADIYKNTTLKDIYGKYKKIF